MQSIAAAAGISRSALYAQFAGMDDLAVALLSRTFAEIGDTDAADRARHDADVTTIAARAAVRLVDHIHGRREFYRSSLDWSVSSRGHDALVERYAETVASSLAVTHPAMPDGERLDLALFVGGGAMSLIRAWLRTESPAPPSALARALLRCMPPEVVGSGREPFHSPATSLLESTEGTP